MLVVTARASVVVMARMPTSGLLETFIAVAVCAATSVPVAAVGAAAFAPSASAESGDIAVATVSDPCRTAVSGWGHPTAPSARQLGHAADESCGGYPAGVVLVGADGLRARRITAGAWSTLLGAPVLSPNGRQVVMSTFRGTRLVVADVRTARGRPIVIASLDGLGGGVEAAPVWSPDSTRIAFSQSGSGTFTVRPDGTDRRELRIGGTAGWLVVPFSWSVRGQLAVKCVEHNHAQCKGLYVVDSDGRSWRRISGDPSRGEVVEQAIWSPDGRRLAFNTDNVLNGHRRVRVSDARGGHQHVVAAGGYPRLVEWLPDSRHLLVLSMDHRRWDLKVVPATGVQRGAKTIVRNVVGAALAADGRHVAFTRVLAYPPDQPVDERLYAAAIDGTHVRQLLKLRSAAGPNSKKLITGFGGLDW